MKKKILTLIVVGVLILGLTLSASSFWIFGGDDEEAADDKITIGFVLMSRSTEFLVAEEWGALEEGKRHENVEVKMVDGQGSSSVQVSAAEDLISQGVDALVLNPYSSGGIVSAVKAANRAGIPVITVDSIAAGGDVDVHVGFDNERGGELAGEYLANVLGGEGKILEIHGPLSAFHAQGRHDGFEKAVANYPDIEVITHEAEQWASNRGREITADVLTAHPDLDAVFSHSDNMMIGAVPALEQAGVNPAEFPLASIDGAPFGLKAVSEGKINVTFAQDPVWMGEKAVQLAVKLAQGEEIEDDAIEMEPIKITEENADDPENWGHKFSGRNE